VSNNIPASSGIPLKSEGKFPSSLKCVLFFPACIMPAFTVSTHLNEFNSLPECKIKGLEIQKAFYKMFSFIRQ